MGYRSNIRCLIYPTNTEIGDPPTLGDDYHALVTLMNTTFKDVVDEFSGGMTLDEKHHVVDFAMDGVKWYESCECNEITFEIETDEEVEHEICSNH